MTYSFRIRFKLGRTVRIGCDDPILYLQADSERPVFLQWGSGMESTPISASETLVLYGHGYLTEDEAKLAGEQWERALQLGFAHVGIGADFGYRSPQGWFSPEGLRFVAAQFGAQRVLNDVHGLMTFETEPKPGFVGGSAEGAVVRPHELVTRAVGLAISKGLGLRDQEQVAYDMYSASFFQPSADARFMLLMMAFETLLVPAPRGERARRHVDELKRVTAGSDLPDSEMRSILGSLDWLYRESIGQAGRRLAARLDPKRYMGESPVRFFTRSYEMRSALVHGNERMPTRDEVDGRAANLQVFVGDVLSLRLDQEVSRS